MSINLSNYLSICVPADVPHVADDGPGLDELLDDGAEDDHTVVRADHHVPGIKSNQSGIRGSTKKRLY